MNLLSMSSCNIMQNNISLKISSNRKIATVAASTDTKSHSHSHVSKNGNLPKTSIIWMKSRQPPRNINSKCQISSNDNIHHKNTFISESSAPVSQSKDYNWSKATIIENKLI